MAVIFSYESLGPVDQIQLIQALQNVYEAANLAKLVALQDVCCFFLQSVCSLSAV